MFMSQRPTVSVTRGWAGRDNATLPEPAGARTMPKNAATPTRRVHAVLGAFFKRDNHGAIIQPTGSISLLIWAT